MNLLCVKGFLGWHRGVVGCQGALRVGGHDRGEPHGGRGHASDQVTPSAGV